jgi:predicted dienelactone hydrolase
MIRKSSFRHIAAVAAAAIALVIARPCRAQQQITIAHLKVAVWLPSDPSAKADWPVIIFSHGYHGSNTQSTFLMQALAKAGYAVFAPNHADAGWGTWKPSEPFADAGKWTDATYADRRNDIERLIAALRSDPRYGAAPFDWDELGMAGHSLGGYTAMGLAGAWPSWKDDHIKAVLALSPYSAPFLYRKTLYHLNVPIMYQGGTLDAGITPLLRKTGGTYDQTPAPKFYVEFNGAGHLAWTDLRFTYHSVIVDYSVAFFDHVLKGKPFPDRLAIKSRNVESFRKAEN